MSSLSMLDGDTAIQMVVVDGQNLTVVSVAGTLLSVGVETVLAWIRSHGYREQRTTSVFRNEMMKSVAKQRRNMTTLAVKAQVKVELVRDVTFVLQVEKGDLAQIDVTMLSDRALREGQFYTSILEQNGWEIVSEDARVIRMNVDPYHV